MEYPWNCHLSYSGIETSGINRITSISLPHFPPLLLLDPGGKSGEWTQMSSTCSSLPACEDWLGSLGENLLCPYVLAGWGRRAGRQLPGSIQRRLLPLGGWLKGSIICSSPPILSGFMHAAVVLVNTKGREPHWRNSKYSKWWSTPRHYLLPPI